MLRYASIDTGSDQQQHVIVVGRERFHSNIIITTIIATITA